MGTIRLNQGWSNKRCSHNAPCPSHRSSMALHAGEHHPPQPQGRSQHDSRPVRRLGIDEHRYRRFRFFRDPTTAKWCRYEPWKTTLVDLDTGVVLGVIDWRGSAGVKEWLTARSTPWFCGVQVVAIHPSAAFRKAIADALPHAAVSVDHFH
jgi:hypothetical protein